MVSESLGVFTAEISHSSGISHGAISAQSMHK
jgi:hypothetical protein